MGVSMNLTSLVRELTDSRVTTKNGGPKLFFPRRIFQVLCEYIVFISVQNALMKVFRHKFVPWDHASSVWHAPFAECLFLRHTLDFEQILSRSPPCPQKAYRSG